MAYIKLIPKSSQAESCVLKDAKAVMDMLFKACKSSLEMPEHDIIVEMSRSTTLSFNSLAGKSGYAPDVVIAVSTSDHELQSEFPALGEAILAAWGGSAVKNLKVELWFQLIDSWKSNINYG